MDARKPSSIEKIREAAKRISPSGKPPSKIRNVRPSPERKSKRRLNKSAGSKYDRLIGKVALVVEDVNSPSQEQAAKVKNMLVQTGFIKPKQALAVVGVTSDEKSKLEKEHITQETEFLALEIENSHDSGDIANTECINNPIVISESNHPEDGEAQLAGSLGRILSDFETAPYTSDFDDVGLVAIVTPEQAREDLSLPTRHLSGGAVAIMTEIDASHIDWRVTHIPYTLSIAKNAQNN
jgi:hypothetical protein